MEKIVETIPYDRVKDFDNVRTYFGDKKVCMFDIETTGLSAKSSFTYIIGINLYIDGEWQIIQLFNDDGRSEPEMIRAFQDIIADYDVLMEFNGDRFDIPYIETRMGFIREKFNIHIPDNFKDILSFDLMKCIRPYKFALGLPNIKQKTVEKYLGIDRVDMYNGGQLIDVYLGYLALKDNKSRELVLRHNRDDMEGMIYLGGILSIDSLSKGFFSITDKRIEELNGKLYLFLSGKLNSRLIKPIISFSGGCELRAQEDDFVCRFPVTTEALRYYYGDKEKDGYEMSEGFFIPSLKGYSGKAPLYKDRARTSEGYIMLDDTFLGNDMLIHEYLTHAIYQIMHNTGKG